MLHMMREAAVSRISVEIWIADIISFLEASSSFVENWSAEMISFLRATSWATPYELSDVSFTFMLTAAPNIK
jgi:hypothetical protein